MILSEMIVPTFINQWSKTNHRLMTFMGTEYYRLLMEAYSELMPDVLYMSEIHGLGHIERTMLLGALIAKAEELSEYETRLLLFACSYHDIGRVNDCRDPLHGRKSARLLNSPLFEAKMKFIKHEDRTPLKAAIAVHSISDSKCKEFAEKAGVTREKSEIFNLLYTCLKDADNLDRVRLGDLDVSHLRHITSRQMSSDAQYIFDMFCIAETAVSTAE